ALAHGRFSFHNTLTPSRARGRPPSIPSRAGPARGSGRGCRRCRTPRPAARPPGSAWEKSPVTYTCWATATTVTVSHAGSNAAKRNGTISRSRAALSFQRPRGFVLGRALVSRVGCAARRAGGDFPVPVPRGARMSALLYSEVE